MENQNKNHELPLVMHAWQELRGPMIFYCFIMAIVFGAFTFGTMYWFRSVSLKKQLTVAGAMVSDALDAGDWDFTLRTLKANAGLGHMHDLRLSGFEGSVLVTGPMGDPISGLGSVCHKVVVSPKLNISACSRIIELPEVVLLFVFSLGLVGFLVIILFLFKGKALDILKMISLALENIEASEDKSGIEEIVHIKSKVRSLMIEAQDTSRTRALNEVAIQVAHDIRSPLAALDVMLADLNIIDSDRRVVIRAALERIHDIAASLLNKYKMNQIVADTELSAQHILSLTQEILTEKRISLRSRPSIHIENNFSDESYCFFSHVCPLEFKRLLSNLLNNSIEALGVVGKVCVAVFQDDLENIIIEIKDNGPGIPQDILTKLAMPGFVSSKAGGTGLGILHARKTLESWGGLFEISSLQGSGTTVKLKISKAQQPSWFVEKIELMDQINIAVVDDDPSIHGLWRERFLKFTENVGCTFKVSYFSTLTELEAACEYFLCEKTSQDWIFLIDYEFYENEYNGLDFIIKWNLQKKAILVSSHVEEKSVKDKCQLNGVRCLSKLFLNKISLRNINSTLRNSAILIDDDPLIHIAWRHQAKAAGVVLFSFNGFKNFSENSNFLERCTPVYIDSNLGNQEKGEDLAKEIFKLGFRTIHLVTGADFNLGSDRPWITSSMGKSPPWNINRK